MFGGDERTGEANAAPTPTFPNLITYEVKQKNGEWVKIEGHDARESNGSLLIHRGIFLDPDCTQVGAVPAGFYAPGEWRGCRTDYQGYRRKSELEID